VSVCLYLVHLVFICIFGSHSKGVEPVASALLPKMVMFVDSEAASSPEGGSSSTLLSSSNYGSLNFFLIATGLEIVRTIWGALVSVEASAISSIVVVGVVPVVWLTGSDSSVGAGATLTSSLDCSYVWDCWSRLLLMSSKVGSTIFSSSPLPRSSPCDPSPD